jgi:hypothetical protein
MFGSDSRHDQATFGWKGTQNEFCRIYLHGYFFVMHDEEDTIEIGVWSHAFVDVVVIDRAAHVTNTMRTMQPASRTVVCFPQGIDAFIQVSCHTDSFSLVDWEMLDGNFVFL